MIILIFLMIFSVSESPSVYPWYIFLIGFLLIDRLVVIPLINPKYGKMTINEFFKTYLKVVKHPSRREDPKEWIELAAIGSEFITICNKYWMISIIMPLLGSLILKDMVKTCMHNYTVTVSR